MNLQNDFNYVAIFRHQTWTHNEHTKNNSITSSSGSSRLLDSPNSAQKTRFDSNKQFDTNKQLVQTVDFSVPSDDINKKERK